MTIPQDTAERLVHGYLEAVARNLVGVPEDRRRELIADLADHIAAERTILGNPTEADIRAILDRLGDPVVVAAEARVDLGPTGWPGVTSAPPRYGTPYPAPVPVRRGLGTGAWVLIAVLGLVAALTVAACVGLFGFRAASSGREGQPVRTYVTPAPFQS